MEVRSCLERVGARTVFFTFRRIGYGRAKPFALGRVPCSSFSAARRRFPVRFPRRAEKRLRSSPFSVRYGKGLLSRASRNGEAMPWETGDAACFRAGRKIPAAVVCAAEGNPFRNRSGRAASGAGGPAAGLVPDALPQQGDFLLPPKRRPGDSTTSSHCSKNVRFRDIGKTERPFFGGSSPEATSSSIPPVPCPGPSRRACAWRGGCTGGRAAGRCRRTRRGRTPDRSRCARRGSVRAMRTRRTG